jgi:hypothetical protein
MANKVYSHVCIDKTGAGLANLRATFVANGIETAQTRGIVLAAGSQKLEHHLHVFLWGPDVDGEKGRLGLVLGQPTNDRFCVWVRWNALQPDGWIFSGTLKGDNGHAGPPAGISTNGAWAYKGNIPADFCFVEGHHTTATPGYDDWKAFRGWSGTG